MRYNIRGQSDLILPNPKTVSFGTESVKFLGPINNASSLSFKQKIKTWTPSVCSCRLCKDYVPGVGFIN